MDTVDGYGDRGLQRAGLTCCAPVALDTLGGLGGYAGRSGRIRWAVWADTLGGLGGYAGQSPYSGGSGVSEGVENPLRVVIEKGFAPLFQKWA